MPFAPISFDIISTNVLMVEAVAITLASQTVRIVKTASVFPVRVVIPAAPQDTIVVIVTAEDVPVPGIWWDS